MANDPIKLRTCKNCGHDNSDTASQCNGCAKSLTGMFSDNYHERWGCPSCSRVNMKENSKCLCGYKIPGCFLTTACVEFAGLPDDCHQLSQMRLLRDCYVKNLPNGSSLIEEYYSVAPHMVLSISAMDELNKRKIYERILSDITEIASHVENSEFEFAKELYSSMYNSLKIELNIN